MKTHKDPLYPLTNPPKEIFAYQHSTPGNEVMGVAIDAQSGAILQAAILPTLQRVQLALGIGNEDAHAHNVYRTFGGKGGYRLYWIENPDLDSRTQTLKNKLTDKAQALINASEPKAHEPAAQEPIPVEEVQAAVPTPEPKPIPDDVQELTTKLVKDNVEGFF